MVFAFAGDSTMTSFLVSDTLLLFQIPLASLMGAFDQVPRAHDTQEKLFRHLRAHMAVVRAHVTGWAQMVERGRSW